MEQTTEHDELIARLRQLINSQEAERKSQNSNYNEKSNDIIINQLKDILNQTTLPKKPEKPKKIKKKKKIKRQDLLKEILEGSAPDKSSSNTPAAELSTGNNQVVNAINNNFNVNFDELGLFDDSHRFGFNFYSDTYQNNIADNDQNTETNKTNEPKETEVPNKTKKQNTALKDFFKYKSEEMFDNYVTEFQLKEIDDKISYTSVISEDIDIVRYARKKNILPSVTPKADVEVLKILGLPSDYDPFGDTSNSKNQKLSYDANRNKFRVKHTLLTVDEEKALKKYRNRVASKRFRKVHSKKQKVDEVALEYNKNLQEIISNILPEIENLEIKVKSLIEENQQLGDALKLKYINRLTT